MIRLNLNSVSYWFFIWHKVGCLKHPRPQTFTTLSDTPHALIYRATVGASSSVAWRRVSCTLYYCGYG